MSSNLIAKLDKAESLDKFLEDNKSQLVVLFFSANWSEESNLMANVIEELIKSEKLDQKIKFLQIEAEEFENISINYSIEAVPTFVFCKNKQELKKFSGANAPELRKNLFELSDSLGPLQQTSSQDNLNDRLKKLINQASITLFMKGTPSEPRCGFSRQMIELLKSQQAIFSYFDILSDNEVREGLKKYSNWPTYPQLYIKGQLVGGLDIVKELIESGEFKTMLPTAEQDLNNRIKSLINQSKIMLFMKGNPKEPKCGFSRQIIEILNETGLKYGSFDILTDEEIRQGLKDYSKWPTYPQVYVDGELVGGLDIMKELKQNGELEQTLKGK